MKIETLIEQCAQDSINGIPFSQIGYIEILNESGNEDYHFSWNGNKPKDAIEAFGSEDLMGKLFDKITFGKDTATIELHPRYTEGASFPPKEWKWEQRYALVVRVK